MHIKKAVVGLMATAFVSGAMAAAAAAAPSSVVYHDMVHQAKKADGVAAESVVTSSGKRVYHDM